MSTYFDMTAANAALKELYDSQALENLVYRKNPFLALVPKFTEFGGKYLPVPIITGVSQGRSATFTDAQTYQSPAQIQSFLLTSKNDYSIATIDNKTLLASKTDKMAFIQGSKVVIDGAIRAATLSLASGLYRSGTGSIAQVSTSTAISTGVITLQNAADVVQFEVNQTLQANATDGGASPRAALGYVISVNRTAGTVTVSTSLGGSAATPSAWTTSDYLLMKGDNNAKMAGALAWFPTTAPGSTDSFYGVNRFQDVTRLAGIRYDGSSFPLEEALIDSSMLVGREDGSPDYFFCNYASYAALDKALGAKVHYVELKGPGGIGFRGIEVNGADGIIKVVPDRNCPALRGFLIQMDCCRLDSLNEAPHIARYADGLEMLRVYNQDSAELRVSFYGNFECQAPGWNANVTLGV